MPSSTPLHFFDIDSILPGSLRSWSSSTLKIRMVLNYKRIPYTQSFISYPDVAPLLKSMSIPPHAKGRMQYTLPAIIHPESVDTNPAGAMMDSFPIACHLDKTFPSPPLFPSGHASYAMALAVEKIMFSAAGKGLFLLLPKAVNVLDQRGKDYFVKTRNEWFGKPLSELEITGDEEVRTTMTAMKSELEIFLRMLTDRPKGVTGPFFEGNKVGYADIILVTFLSWGHRVDLKV